MIHHIGCQHNPYTGPALECARPQSHAGGEAQLDCTFQYRKGDRGSDSLLILILLQLLNALLVLGDLLVVGPSVLIFFG